MNPSEPVPQRFVIVGAGAVGGTLGGLLAKARPTLDLGPLKRTKLLGNLGNVVKLLYPAKAQPQVVAQAIEEGERVLRAAGLPFAPRAAFGAERVPKAALHPVAGARRGDGSTWQSHARSQPLETDYLNGETARLAESMGLDAPVNRRLLQAARVLGNGG